MIREASHKPNSWQQNFVLIQMLPIFHIPSEPSTRANITRTIA